MPRVNVNPEVSIDTSLLRRLGVSDDAFKNGFIDIDLRTVKFEDLDALKKFALEGANGPLNKSLEEFEDLKQTINLNKKPTEAEIDRFKASSTEAKTLYLKDVKVKDLEIESPKKFENLGKIIAESNLESGMDVLRKTGLPERDVAIVYKKLQKAGEKIHTRLLKKIGLLDEAGNADLVKSMKLVVAGGVVTVVGYLVYFVIANAGKIPEAIRDVMVSLGESAGDAAAFAAETAADVASGGLDTFFKGLSLPLLIGGVVFFVFFIIMMIMLK
jgi:hypothetical protein